MFEPLLDKDYKRLIGYTPIPEHDVRKVAKAQLEHILLQVGVKLLEIIDGSIVECEQGRGGKVQYYMLREMVRLAKEANNG